MTTTAPAFNLVPAEACTCCNRKIKQGYDVPFIGVVGPKCVRKFALLSSALTILEGLQFARLLTGETGLATRRLFSGLRALGFDPKKHVSEDGTCTLVVGKLATWRTYTKLRQTWEERRAEFERDLQIAGAALMVAPEEVTTEALTEEGLTAMTPSERRVVAALYGVLTPAGRPSESVARIWAAVEAAQVAEAQAVAPMTETPAQPDVAALAPRVDLEFLSVLNGATKQLEQRHFAQVPVAVPVVRVVPRAEFPVPMVGVWSGGTVEFFRMTGWCWGGRQGALLVRWDDLKFLAAQPQARSPLALAPILNAAESYRQWQADADRAEALLEEMEAAPTLEAAVALGRRHALITTHLRTRAVMLSRTGGPFGPRAQLEQRHLAGPAHPKTVVCVDCGATIQPGQAEVLLDSAVVCPVCADAWRTELAQDGPRQQPEQQQAQAAAPVLAAFEPECRCGRLLSNVGRCGHCDQQPVRISACTGDLNALLQRPGYERGDVAYVIATPEGELSLRTVPAGVRLDLERFRGAIAGLVISEPVLLDLVTDLMLCLRHGSEGLWAEGSQVLTVPEGALLLGEQTSGVRLIIDRQGGTVAWVTLDEAGVRELVTELMLSLRRQHWGAA